MTEIIRNITSIQSPFNMVVIIVMLVVVGGLVGEIIKQAGKFAIHRQEIELKRDLLDRGLPADEIERVVRAHSPKTSKDA